MQKILNEKFQDEINGSWTLASFSMPVDRDEYWLTLRVKNPATGRFRWRDYKFDGMEWYGKTDFEILLMCLQALRSMYMETLEAFEEDALRT